MVRRFSVDPPKLDIGRWLALVVPVEPIEVEFIHELVPILPHDSLDLCDQVAINVCRREQPPAPVANCNTKPQFSRLSEWNMPHKAAN